MRTQMLQTNHRIAIRVGVLPSREYIDALVSALLHETQSIRHKARWMTEAWLDLVCELEQS